MKRYPWKRSLRQRAEAAEAGAAALRDALEAFHPGRSEEASETSEECQECGDHYVCRDDCSASAECDICAHDILEHGRAKAREMMASTDAGKPMLERLRKAEEDAKRTRKECNSWIATCALAGPQSFHRLLRACQSLHRAWGRASDEAARMTKASECWQENTYDARAEVVKLMMERDEARRERDALDAHATKMVRANDELEQERDALRAEVERLRERLSAEHLCAHGAQSCDACTDSWSIRERLLVKERDAARAEGDEAAHQLRLMKEEERDALARGIAAMASDGLDIDDPGTAPVWTGKVLDTTTGAVVYDAATRRDWRATLGEAIEERDALRAENAALRQTITVTATDEVQRRWREMEREAASTREDNRRLQSLVTVAHGTRDDALAERDALKAEVERLREALADEQRCHDFSRRLLGQMARRIWGDAP